MKPRILHVIRTLELGGAETNLRNLMQVFDLDRYEHHIAYSFGGEIEDFFKANPKVQRYCYSRAKHSIKSLHTFLIMVRLWAYIVRQRIQVVHTHNFNAHFWAVYPAKLAGAKVVEHVHDFRYFGVAELEKRKGIATQVHHIGLFKGLSDRVVVLTGQNRRFLLERKLYPENKIRIIPNGIPIPERTESTKRSVCDELGLNDKDLMVLVASRMTPTKNIELVLRSAPEVVRQAPGTVFVIAGNGEMADSYKEMAARLQLGSSVQFIGFYPDVPRLLKACDIFWLPSFMELHSISILEAQSIGVPMLISSDVGCHDEVFTDGKDAFLLDPFSDEGWAETLIKLLKDPGLRQTVGKSGRDLCLKLFDIRNTARTFEALYDELISS